MECSLYNEGAQICQAYQLVDPAVAINTGDVVNPELHLFNSYDVPGAQVARRMRTKRMHAPIDDAI